MKHFAIKRTDGGVSIMHVLPVGARKVGETEEWKIVRRAGDTVVLFLQREIVREDGEIDTESFTETARLDDPEWEFLYLTPESQTAKWPAARQAEIVSVREIGPGDVPADREFRDAWEDDGAAVRINMPRARDIQAARIDREKRAKIRDLMEREALGEDVTAEKDAVRAIDARTLVDAAATPGDLKATWPSELSRAT